MAGDDQARRAALRIRAVERLAGTVEGCGALEGWRRVACGVDGLLKRLGLAERLQRGSLVFMFHRLTEGEDPIHLGFELRQFEWLCQFLAERYEVLPLMELERRRRSRRPPSAAVALTFDDGYVDNLTLGLPILRRYGLLATVFITTGAVNGGRPLWTARLAYLVEHGQLAAEQPLQICGVSVQLGSAEQREACFGAVAEALKRVDGIQREEELGRLEEALGVTDYGGLRNEMLTWDQVRACDAAGLTAGAHTATHPILSRVSDAQLEREIAGCKEELEGQLGRKVQTFAYPNGKPHDYDARCIALLRRSGYEVAYTTVFGANTARTAPYEQRRVTAYGQTHAHLALQTERFFYLTR